MATTPNDAASREALEKYNSDDTQPATARLKKRKAASAYLARQRHKSFVGGLQNETSALESRVMELRSRKGKLFEACGSAMRERMCAAPEHFSCSRMRTRGADGARESVGGVGVACV